MCQALLLLQAAAVIVLVQQLGCHGRACGYCCWHVSSCDCAGGNRKPWQRSVVCMVGPARPWLSVCASAAPVTGGILRCFLPCGGLDKPV